MMPDQNGDIPAQRTADGAKQQSQDFIISRCGQGLVKTNIRFNISVGFVNYCLHFIQTSLNELIVFGRGSLSRQPGNFNFK